MRSGSPNPSSVSSTCRGSEPPPLTHSGYSFQSGCVELFRGITVDRRDLGTVYLKSDLLELNTRLEQYAKIVGVVLLVSLSVAWLISYRLYTIWAVLRVVVLVVLVASLFDALDEETDPPWRIVGL